MWYNPIAGNLIISRAAISKFSREPPERSDGAAKEPCRVFAVFHPYRVPIPVHLGRAAILARSMPAPGCVSFVSFVSFFHSRSIRVRRNRSRLRAEKTHKTHKTHMSVNYGIGPGPARRLRALCRTGRPRARARRVTGAARDLPDRSMVDPYPLLALGPFEIVVFCPTQRCSLLVAGSCRRLVEPHRPPGPGQWESWPARYRSPVALARGEASPAAPPVAQHGLDAGRAGSGPRASPHRRAARGWGTVRPVTGAQVGRLRGVVRCGAL
jgi:hypothetical protein